MNNKKKLNEVIVNHLLEIVNERIGNALKSIDSAKESRDSETKSSVGDKYETGRSMVQFELEKHNIQLLKAQQQKHELSQIQLKKKSNKVEFGSLVTTNEGIYFISVSFGKIDIDGEEIFCISLASPIGKAFHNKKVGDMIVFQGKEIVITDIG